MGITSALRSIVILKDLQYRVVIQQGRARVENQFGVGNLKMNFILIIHMIREDKLVWRILVQILMDHRYVDG